MISLVQNLTYFKVKGNCGCFYCKFKSKTGKKSPNCSTNSPHSSSGPWLAWLAPLITQKPLGGCYPESPHVALAGVGGAVPQRRGSWGLCQHVALRWECDCWPMHCITLHLFKKGQVLWKLVPFGELNSRPGADACSVLISHNSPHAERGGVPAEHLFLVVCGGVGGSTSAESSKDSNLVAASSSKCISFFSRGEISQMTCAF